MAATKDLSRKARIRGLWDVDCREAIHVTDPEKAASLLGKYGISFLSPQSVLHHNTVSKVLPYMRSRDAHAFEKLLAGGGLKFQEHYENIVVNQGLDHLLDATLAAQTQITAWYVALFEANYTILSSTTAANFTANATESTAYSESTRQAWTANGASSGQSVSNSSARATFSINATKTIYGAALLSASAKSATTGTMYAGGQFASSRSVVSGDSLLVTATFTAADDGV